MDLTLGEIADLLDTSQKLDRSFAVSGVSTDSRSMRAGMLFFALRGEHFDGHAFIDDAIQKKACGVVADRTWLASRHKEYASPVFSVPDPLMALQEVTVAVTPGENWTVLMLWVLPKAEPWMLTGLPAPLQDDIESITRALNSSVLVMISGGVQSA